MRNLRKSSVIGITVFIMLLMGSALLRADPGDLDLTFGGGDGYVTTDILEFDFGNAVVIDANGGIIAAGTSTYTDDTNTSIEYGFIARYLTDGSPDLNFGDSGSVVIDHPHYTLNLMSLDAIGRIVITGGENGTAVLSRFNADGSPDLTFGDQGTVTNPDWNGFVGLYINTDGDITVTARIYGTNPASGLVRYKSDGTLDTSFGDQGTVDVVPFTDALSLLSDVNGSFIVIGTYEESDTMRRIVLAKYLASGLLDTQFGTDGIVVSSITESNSAGRAVRDASDRILVTGLTIVEQDGIFFRNVLILRYLPNGTLDSTFGNNGLVTTTAMDGLDSSAVITDNNGKIIITGLAVEHLAHQDTYSLFIARYNPDGTPDNTFGDGDGLIFYRPAPDQFAAGSGMVLDTSGRILIAGFKGIINNYSDLLVARFQADFPSTATPTATDTSTATLTSTPTPTGTATEVTPTATQAPETNVLVNSGFEANSGSSDGWGVKKATKDKVKCDQLGKPPVAHEGNCAFRFKGGVGENSQLFQKPDLTGNTFAGNENFTFEAYIHAKGQIDFKAQAKFIYADDSAEKIMFELTPADAMSDYVLYSGDYALTSADLSKIKVMFKNKSESGKIDVDEVRLSYTTANAVRLLPMP